MKKWEYCRLCEALDGIKVSLPGGQIAKEKGKDLQQWLDSLGGRLGSHWH